MVRITPLHPKPDQHLATRTGNPRLRWVAGFRLPGHGSGEIMLMRTGIGIRRSIHYVPRPLRGVSSGAKRPLGIAVRVLIGLALVLVLVLVLASFAAGFGPG